ncbi:hypothetical protein GCM10011507_24510 [Edaphobacter acidisoli]|uniref:Sulfatase N-terminal domain-containing protein n=1 Tax=Edaphobacter acidisoli TaxID=2040573 RepID=A0A916RXS0_9BACT|nr:sulfatase-like hydrolase/transferase [Edaphobacter acidisoli]GGA72002.1 hypothetical protein GCM10011507_24510 [Edaphobacter acidisoli]
MKRFLKQPAITALGLTQLYLLTLVGQLLSPNHLFLYHWSGSAPGIFLPTALVYCTLWISLTLLLLLVRRPGWSRTTVWIMLLAIAPIQLIKSWPLVSGQALPRGFLLTFFGLAIVVFLIMVVKWRHEFLQKFDRVIGIFRTCLGFVALIGLLALSQMLWFGWRARRMNAALPLHKPQLFAKAKPRIIWVLFDELSYRQVYERRYPGLELPAFDQLAGQSTVFTDTVPAGYFTERVLPSLFTGIPVATIKSSVDGHTLFLYEPDSRSWVRFDPTRTVFADALNHGYSTAIAGWYNPYCRIMPGVLDHCFWTIDMPNFSVMSPQHTILENARDTLLQKARTLLQMFARPKSPVFNAEDTRLHQMDYTHVSAAADRLIEDPSATFVLLHMPVPHPGGIYDRKIGRFTTHGATYIDNLALADRYLAHIRSLLEQNGTWDASTIVVMGDHSWRTNQWKLLSNWTPEEQRASDGGQFDPRPGYIIKLPYQHTPYRVNFAYRAIHTRALFDALIAGEIHSPEELSKWAAQWHDSPSSALNSSAK